MEACYEITEWRFVFFQAREIELPQEFEEQDGLLRAHFQISFT